jgi:hypothetical protein
MALCNDQRKGLNVPTGARRSHAPFPPPWSVEETDACFIVCDANGQALAYVYFEGELDRRSAAHFRDEVCWGFNRRFASVGLRPVAETARSHFNFRP